VDDRISFGFSVAGSNPVRVSRVDASSGAEISGLMRDDQMFALNGVDVMYATSVTVAQIIRYD